MEFLSSGDSLPAVVIVVEDEISELVLAQMTTWANAELVYPSIWIDARELTGTSWAEGLSARLSGLGLTNGHLASFVKERPVSLVRLVAVRWTVGGRPDAGSDLHSAARLVDEALRALLPEASTVRLQVVVTDGEAQVSRAALLPGWTTVVISPEDRAGDRHPDLGVRGPRLVGHSALALSTVAGLWRQAADHPLDRLASGSTDMVVVRSMARVVVVASLFPDLLAAALEAISPSEGFVGGIPSASPELAVERAARKVIEKHRESVEMCTRDPGRRSRSTEECVAEARALADAAPHLEGVDGSRTIDDVRLAAERVLGKVGSPTDLQPTAALWHSLCQLSLGLVDGSQLPAGFDQPKEGRFQEYLPAHLVVPKPESELHVTGLGSLRAVDPYHWRLFESRSAASDDDSMDDGDDTTTAWLSSRRYTLLWRIADHVAQEVADACGALSDAMSRLSKPDTVHRLETYQSPHPPTAALHSPVREIAAVACFLLAVLVLIGALGVALVLVAVSLAVAGAGWLAATRSHLAQLEQIEPALAACDAAINAASRLVRVCADYDQLLDWADVIAWMLRPPVFDRESVPQDEPPGLDGLPAAFGLRRVATNPAVIARTVSELAQATRKPGWATERLAAIQASAKLEFDPAEDVARSAGPGLLGFLPPRKELLRAVASAQRTIWDQLATRIEERLRAIDPTSLVRPSDIDFLAEVDPPDEEAPAPLSKRLWTPASEISGRNKVANTWLWVPKSLGAPHSASIEPLVATHSCTGPSLVLMKIRLDLAGPCRADELSLFDTEMQQL